MKMLFAFAVLAVMVVPVKAQHDSFNDPKYPGIPAEADCPAGFDCTGLAQSVHVAPRLELIAGHAQIGHVPGRIDVLRPTVKELSLGQNVHFVLTVLWSGGTDHPCSATTGCIASVGIRHRPDGFTSTWTTFTLRTEQGDRRLTLDLPSKADDNVLPCGHHDVFVRIRNDQDTLLERLVPVSIHADRCPEK